MKIAENVANFMLNDNQSISGQDMMVTFV